jgi:hypothetical protein
MLELTKRVCGSQATIFDFLLLLLGPVTDARSDDGTASKIHDCNTFGQAVLLNALPGELVFSAGSSAHVYHVEIKALQTARQRCGINTRRGITISTSSNKASASSNDDVHFEVCVSRAQLGFSTKSHCKWRNAPRSLPPRP